jgi:hypothetical protein
MTGGRGVSKYCYKARGSADLCANRMAFMDVTFSASKVVGGSAHLETSKNGTASFIVEGVTPGVGTIVVFPQGIGDKSISDRVNLEVYEPVIG